MQGWLVRDEVAFGWAIQASVSRHNQLLDSLS